MATAITTTAQDITGDFDLQVSGLSDDSVQLMKSLGPGTTNFEPVDQLSHPGQYFVKNTGTNAYKLSASLPGGTVSFSQ